MSGQKQEKGGNGTLVIVALVAFAVGRMTAEDKPVPTQPQSFVAQPAVADEVDSPVIALPTATVAETPTLAAEPIAVPEIDSSPQSFSASSTYADSEIEADEPSVYYRNCSAARADGAAPIHEGEPGYAYHLDRDRDGIACE